MNSSIIVLHRAQMAHKRNVQNPIDTTVKSAKIPWKYLAPTWNMVMAHKAGTMSDDTYTELYRQILDKAPWTIILNAIKTFYEDDTHITFMCYCPDGVFCHTHIIIDYLLERWPLTFTDGR